MTLKHALIIDDEPDIRELLEITLMRMGLETHTAANIEEAHSRLAEQAFDLCLTDMNLPDGNGIDLVGFIQAHYPQTPVAMITAYGNVETAISALKAGAFDFISKPIDLGHLRQLISSALALEANTHSAPTEQNNTKIKGNAPAIQHLNQQIDKLARSQAPVYIAGESGAGKELAAKLIHTKSFRAKNGAFIPVNCGAIPSELVESEFFGHKKGSFSGAIEDKVGLFRAAHGGTLFLDEVADLPLDMQVKLLRAIQEKKVRPVGEQTEIDVDVRILSATHKNLEKLVESGEFRQDLYYRINVIRLDVPSLRERREDIPLLAEHFLSKLSQECGVDHAKFSPEALSALNDYHFPGNVRELENLIERAFTLCENNIIQKSDLNIDTTAPTPHQSAVTVAPPSEAIAPPPSTPQATSRIAAEFASSNTTTNLNMGLIRPPAERPEGLSLESYLEQIERYEIEKALISTKWNRTAAAKTLGISFRALRYRLKKLDLD